VAGAADPQRTASDEGAGLMESAFDERGLNRANIEVAWCFANQMTPEQFKQLCRVTVELWRDGADVGELSDPVRP